MTKQLELPIKVCLLGASFATSNLGIKALASGAIKSISLSFPQAEITILDYVSKRNEYHYDASDYHANVRMLNMRFSKKLYAGNHIVALLASALILKMLPKGMRINLIKRNEILDSIHASSFVTTIAAGDSFSDLYGLMNLIYVSLPQVLAILLEKKLVLLPQTIGPFRGKISKMFAKLILNRADTIYVREPEGLNEVRSLLKKKKGNNHLKFSYDLGFILDAKKPAGEVLGSIGINRVNEGALVGLNVSGMLYQGSYSTSQKRTFGLITDYKDLINSVIEFFIKEKKTTILLIPHVFGSLQSDLTACKTIYESLKDTFPGKLQLVQGTEDHREIKYLIGTCDYFIGSRMHACIAAISQAVPSVAIAYSDKFKRVIGSIGLVNIVADPRYMSKTEILSMINETFEKRQEIKLQITTVMPDVKNSVMVMFDNMVPDLREREDKI
jgi:polysaccharide pyruvyl transferase WcaK-like protein